jgi:hypothetical protein
LLAVLVRVVPRGAKEAALGIASPLLGRGDLPCEHGRHRDLVHGLLQHRRPVQKVGEAGGAQVEAVALVHRFGHLDGREMGKVRALLKSEGFNERFVLRAESGCAGKVVGKSRVGLGGGRLKIRTRTPHRESRRVAESASFAAQAAFSVGIFWGDAFMDLELKSR